MKICAVIPAAGRGTRLGLDVPKILAPITDDATIWGILKQTLKPFVDHIHVVLSREGEPLFADLLTRDPDREFVSTSIQPEPVGMGDAIFRGFPIWRDAQTLLVIWGDQVHVSPDTLASSLAIHAGKPRRIVLPVVALDEPYVEYRFDAAGGLTTLLQSREGDACARGGYGDVGTFVLSTAGLPEAWHTYLARAERGSRTGEINFLPFLVFLSQIGWEVRRHIVSDPNEARGINTPEDLLFFRGIYDARGHEHHRNAKAATRND
jgi:bifunctional UDP-N-acetylglucosamine pyrophosphorylase / glucosamine-1-phosphate N-acetyltransferase